MVSALNRMTRRTLVGALAFVLGTGSAFADSLQGQNRLLCAAVEATLCTGDGVCDSGPAWDFRVPQFIEVDLKGKLLTTTAASGENRSTPIKNLTRDQGLIVLQGVQLDRAFSAVLHEADGRVTFAIASDGIAVNVFGACTPMEGK